jgi:lipoprotein-anchoring transpeptidase ErfK/SrfK
MAMPVRTDRTAGTRTRTERGWTIALATVLAVALPAAGCAGPVEDQDPAGQALATSAPATPPSTTTPPPQSPPPAGPTTEPPATTGPAPPAPDLLRAGATGPEVRELQERLVELGYWLGEPDGVFGTGTRHAVVAFQKANQVGIDGVAGPQTRDALESADRPAARSEAGRVVEVDLDRQLMLIAVDGRVEHVFDTSTGAQPGTTPPGRYQVFRQVDGYDHGPLGTLYRPKYFVGGVAVHGYPEVPPYPASHGCVRVTNAAMDWLWRTGMLPIGQPVWVY